MADKTAVIALNVREMRFSVSRSLGLVYEINTYAFMRYLNENEVIESNYIVFFNKRLIIVHKVIVQVWRQTKFQSQQKAIVTSDV